MNRSLHWQETFFAPIFAIALIALMYCLYYYLTKSHAFRKFVQVNFGSAHGVAQIVLERLTGFILLGCIPALSMVLILDRSIDNYGLQLNDILTSLAFFTGLATIIVPVYIAHARKQQTQQLFPKIRELHWDLKLLSINTFSVMVFLLGYEFAFRGVLLYECATAFGSWPAISISTALYVCVHLPCPPMETLGAIPLGIAMAYIALYTGNIWVPYAAHVLIALSLDYFALYYNPQMKVITTWNRRV